MKGVLDTILRESALQTLRFEVLHAEFANLKRRIQDLPAAIAEEVAAQSAISGPPDRSMRLKLAVQRLRADIDEANSQNRN